MTTDALRESTRSLGKLYIGDKGMGECIYGRPNRPKDPAILFEVKTRKKFNEMEDGLQEAYDQIRDRKYEEGILDDGYLGVRSYGICFCKKSCIVGRMNPCFMEH